MTSIEAAGIPMLLGALAATALLALGSLYLMSILGAGRRRANAAVRPPAVVGITRADSAARHLGPDGRWDYTVDATRGAAPERFSPASQ